MRNEVIRVEELKLRAENGSSLKNVYLDLYEGEFYGVFIRNPMLRTALINALLGNKRDYSGRYYLFEKPAERYSASQIRRLGVYGIYDNPHLIPGMSIAENFFLTDSRYYKFGFAKKKAMSVMAREILKEYGLEAINSETMASRLRFSDAHLIEIVKNVAMGAKILLIDNISERYSQKDILNLQSFLSDLLKRKITIIYFTNRYSTLLDLANRVTIIHSGHTVMTLQDENLSKKDILRYYDREKISYSQKSLCTGNPTIMDFSNVHEYNSNIEFDFSLKEGEVLGILDEDQTLSESFLNIVYGNEPYSGTIELDNKPIFINTTQTAVKNGIVLLDENYHSSTLFQNMNLLDNVTLMMKRPLYSFWGLRNNRIYKYVGKKALERVDSNNLFERYSQFPALPHISKHNQTKIVLAKWLCLNPKVIIMINPFTSFDDLTEHELYKLIHEISELKISIIIFSMNSTELKPLVHRIIQPKYSSDGNSACRLSDNQK